MKLLSPIAVKDVRGQELARDVLRIKETKDELQRVSQQLANAQADFNVSLARNRETWANEEQEHSKRLTEMTKEVEFIEERKKQALIPINMYKSEADKIMSDALEYKKSLDAKEEQIENTIELLESKLTDVADREQKVSLVEKKQKVAQEGILKQQEATRNGTQLLSEQIAQFHVKQQEDDKLWNKRKRELDLKEINLEVREEKNIREIGAIRVREAQVQDMRETLEREYVRLNIPIHN